MLKTSFEKINYLLKKNLQMGGIKEYSSHYFLDSYLNDKSIVLDFGANKGNFYSALQKKFNCSFHVVEASKELFDNLPSLPKTYKYNYAICKSNGPIEFIISDNSEANSLYEPIAKNWGLSKKMVVDGINYDTFIKKHKISQNIDLLKIDIEGAEIELLENITSNNLKSISQIAIEFHDFLFKDELYSNNLKFVIKRLESLGFLAVKISNLDWREVLFINKHLIKLTPVQKIRLTFFNNILQKTKFIHSFLSSAKKNV